MNQQGPAGSAGTLASAKRKRGRPRKEDVPAPPEKLIPLRAPALYVEPLNVPLHGSGAPLPAEATSCFYSGFDDLQVGHMVFGVLEGTFDAGFLLSVDVGEGKPPLRGLIFNPGKFVPVTPENDVAPSVKMHKRMSVSEVAPEDMKTEVIEETIVVEPSYGRAVVCESSVAQDVVKEVCKEQDEKVIDEDAMECEGQGSSEKKEVETGNGSADPKLELSLCSSFETPVLAVEPPEAGEKEKGIITVEIQQENHQEKLAGDFMDVGHAQDPSFGNAVLEGDHTDAPVPFSGTADVSPKVDETILSESVQPEGVIIATAELVPPPEAIGASLVERVPPPPESIEVKSSPEVAQEQVGGQAALAEQSAGEAVEEKGPEELGGMVGDI